MGPAVPAHLICWLMGCWPAELLLLADSAHLEQEQNAGQAFGNADSAGGNRHRIRRVTVEVGFSRRVFLMK